MTLKITKNECKSKFPNSCTTDPLKTSLSRDYKNNLKKQLLLSSFQEMNQHEAVKELVSLPENTLFWILDNLTFSDSLLFNEPALIIFYSSILCYQSKDEKIKIILETDLIRTLYNEFLKDHNKSEMYALLSKCFIRFSNKSIESFMKCFSWNFSAIRNFIVLITNKLSPSVIQIWFENDFEFVDKIFQKMNFMVLSEKTPFNKNLFVELLKYGPFRRAVFNGQISLDFIIKMKDYANRPDFEYFYNKNHISRNIQSDLPKDYADYSFFIDFKGSHGDLIKIRKFQKMIGHSYILNMWISENTDSLIKIALDSTFESSELVEAIFKDTIIFNSSIITRADDSYFNSKDCHDAVLINNKLFDKFKDNEEYFRSVAHLFYKPANVNLQRLILKDFFSIDISDAFKLINRGYEEELIEYFKTKEVSSFTDQIDDWSLPFFLRFFSSCVFTEKDALEVLNFISQNNLIKTSLNEKLIYEIYNKICKIESEKIMMELPNVLKFVYCLKHRRFALDFMNRNECTLLEASQIYELRRTWDLQISKKSNKIELNSSLKYKSAISDDILFDNQNVIQSLFMNNFILQKDSYFLFVLYFDSFLDQVIKCLSKENIIQFVESPYDFSTILVTGNDVDRIASCFKNECTYDLNFQIAFIMHFNLLDKYTLFILFEKILNVLLNGTSSEKIFLLNFIDPCKLTKNHLLRYIDCLIVLLNSPNRILCNLSKMKFKDIRVETQEIQNILPLIIQCFESKGGFVEFINRFQTIFFNNYLCFSSLNIIVQLLFRYLPTNTRECLTILSRIINITKDKDIKHISGLVFSNISKFVVNSHFYTKEALAVASQFCLYATFSDFDILIKNSNSLRICNYLVGVLKAKGDSELNDRIINKVLNNTTADTGTTDHATADTDTTDHATADTGIIDHTTADTDIINLDLNKTEIDNFNLNNEKLFNKNLNQDTVSHSAIEPSFIAAACELPEFVKYLNRFVPVIKDLMKSSKIESRQISCKAIQSIFQNASLKEYKEELKDFLIELCIFMDHNVKLSVLDVMEYLPIIYILRNDNHTLVKKKAYDIWKERVSNTNKQLKLIYKEVLSFLQYSDVPVFSVAIKSSVSEMAIKYSNLLENYVEDPETPLINKELVLVESAKISKLIPLAVLFCESHECHELFKILFKNPSIKDQLIKNTKQSLLLELCADDCDLALFLFDKTSDLIYVDFLTAQQKIEIIKNHFCRSKTVTLSDENVIFILQSIDSSNEIEHLLMKIHPSFSYFYLSVNRISYGFLDRLFERVFDVCQNFDELINDRSIMHLKNCSFERVNDKTNLLSLLITFDDRKSFERSVEIIKMRDFKPIMDQNDLFILLGYFFRNYLSVNRRTDAEDCILKIYEEFKSREEYLGFFAHVIKTALLK